MAPCENNPYCKNKNCPQNGGKRVKTAYLPTKNKEVRQRQFPESVANLNPAWSFRKVDKEGSWAWTEERLQKDGIFWKTIFPRLESLESLTWNQIEAAGSHFIDYGSLNKVAQVRLDELKISVDSVFSLRISGERRIYGLRPEGVLYILWYDNNHGDNDTCVCRSKKKNTHR